MTEDFNAQKNTKFIEIISNEYESFFDVTNVGKQRVCAITGIEDESCVPLDDKGEDNKIFVLPSVREQVNLGKALRDKEKFKTFEDYAENSFLGVLRMDVDGLGKLFINGFPSMTEYKKFSGTLLEFFDNKVREIKSKAEFNEHINIIYAGGDDLFVIGHWGKVIEFADTVRIEFAKTVGEIGVTISGGVAIIKPKFPIAKAAEIAGEAEDAAKKFNNFEKNAFNMFGETVSWSKEFDYVKQFKQEFVDLISNYGMSRGILHKIIQYAITVRTNEQKAKQGVDEDYSYMWHSTYYLTRYIKRYDKVPEIKDFCKNLKNKELSSSSRKYTLLSVAARWAELELRDNN